MSRIGHLWLVLRSSLWFAPTLLVLAALLLAAALIELDVRLSDDGLERLTPLLTGSPEGARAMLAAIAGSMITVAGVVFSITIVTLSLASSQYSPRVLRGFMKDATNQLVLGVFVGIFAYCLVVLGAIRSDSVQFVPAIAVLGGAVLALVGIGFLILFIHHTATSIQVSNIVAAVAAETLDAIERTFREAPDAERERPAADPRPRGWMHVRAPYTGFVQRLDHAALTSIAADAGTCIRSGCRVGDFVVEGTVLASMAGTGEIEGTVRSRVVQAYTTGHQRTVEQDPAWGIRQIVDIATRALSPGINDATTAITCLHYLVAIVLRLAGLRLPSGRFCRDGELRLVVPTSSFGEFVVLAFADVRHAAAGNPAVLAAVVDALADLGEGSPAAGHAAILAELDAGAESITRTVEATRERSDLLARVARARARLVGQGRDAGASASVLGGPQAPQEKGG